MRYNWERLQEIENQNKRLKKSLIKYSEVFENVYKNTQQTFEKASEIMKAQVEEQATLMAFIENKGLQEEYELFKFHLQCLDAKKDDLEEK